MNQNRKTSGTDIMPTVLDKELSDFSEDAFGHQHFANALGNLIEGPHRPPFSIGLLGPWGTGKSTIKELYLASLASDASGPKGQKRKNRCHAISFNAWRYGGEADIKRALLRHVFLQLGGDDVELRRNLYHQVTDSARNKRGWREWFKEALLQNAATTGLFVVLFASIMGIIWFVSYLLGLSDQWGLTVLLTVAAVVTAFLSKNVVDIRLKSPTLFNDQTVISFPATSAEEYERLLVDQIGKFRASREGRSCERLVVFVDDLDRLSAAEMVSGLDAVRTFLELPFGNGSDNFGVIFVISCDEDRVADALSRGRGRVNPDLPGSVFTRSDARRYLDRLFQFRLEIPPFPKLDMRQFTENKLREARVLADEIEQQGVRIQDVVERLIHVGVRSPRNAIQILNAFTQTWWIAIQREHSGAGSTEPGALYDGAVSKHPIALAALCVLRVDFPDFYNELQKRPELIQEFNRVVFRNGNIDSLAIGAQFALKDFIVVQDEKDGAGKIDVRPEYRNLRQYLSSLLDLRWPKSLQPLLLLAQDAISRKYGDRAAELNDAFVSGDTRGVLEVFGHHLDNEDIGREDIRLLEELVSGASEETLTRRVNGARVLAAIAHRIPSNYRKGLMVPLARQMIDLKDIRTNVGPTAAKEIIATLDAADRREVAEKFSSDLLTGEKLEWRLPTGETPNLEELVLDVKAAVELVLDVKASDELLPATNSRLRNWLLEREVQSSQGAQTLAFDQLEVWMLQHTERLLNLLNDEYTRLGINELVSESSSIPDKELMLQRFSQVFKRLAEGGQESRKKLWEQLVTLVTVRDPEGVSTAWTEAGFYAALASTEQARTFLLALADRLQKEMDDGEQWELDWDRGTQQFLDLATRWERHIDQSTASGVLKLVRSWASFDETSIYIPRIADILKRRDKESWVELIGDLTGRAFEAMHWGSLQYIAKNILELNDQQKKTLAGQLNGLVNSDAIDKKDAENYKKFIITLPQSAWSLPPLEGHAKTTRDRLISMFNRADYLSAIFPAARLLFGVAPKGQVSEFLNSLFDQAASSPEAYPILHREMAGHWPEENEQTGQYDPNHIALRAIQFIRENPKLPGAAEVFKSVVDMVKRGIAEESVHSGISASVAILWPHSPSAVSESINSIALEVSPADVTKILTGRQPNDLSSEHLQVIVDALSSSGDQQRCLGISKEILNVEPKQINDQPDGALSIWLSSLREKEREILKLLIHDQELNETQKERLLIYVLSNSRRLGLVFFVEIVPDVLLNANQAKPLGVFINKIDEIISLAQNSDQRSSLASSFVKALPNVSGDTLAKVARAINSLNGKGMLDRNTDILEKLDIDQLEILSREIPGSKVMARYLKSRGNESAS